MGWLSGFWLAIALLIPPSARADGLLVAAAASLTDALREIGTVYEQQHRNRVAFNFAASSTLARQIEEGAPVDVFFSADLEKMDRLERRGLIEKGSRRELLSNQLVVVLPRDSGLAVRSAKDLLGSEIRRIAVAEPASVPVGIYARQYLQAEGIWERVKGKVIPVLDARAALAAVESGNVEAGLVYRTDAAVSRGVRVAYEVPLEKGPKIIYPVAIIRDSSRKEAARDWLRFVRADRARRIFTRYGFIALP